MELLDGRYCAIDIGTVTTRMLIADVDNNQVVDLDREYTITNLGEGGDASGVLSREAMIRVNKALDHYLSIRDSFELPDDCMKMAVMATSAARDAANADDFSELLRHQGLSLSVISGQEEAALGFLGASKDFLGESLIVVDIGGGSTEVVCGRAGFKPDKAHSFNIGCRRVTERFLYEDPLSVEEVEAARHWIRGEFQPYFDEIHEECQPIDRLVAVAGTATTVVSVRDQMVIYDSERVHKSEVWESELESVAHELMSVPLDKRSQIVGLEPGRAPVICAGMIILEEVLRAAQMDRFTVSETDILHGMIMETARKAALEVKADK